MKNRQIVLRIEEELYDKIKKYADENDFSVAYVVRLALKEFSTKLGGALSIRVPDETLKGIQEVRKHLNQIEKHIKEKGEFFGSAIDEQINTEGEKEGE